MEEDLRNGLDRFRLDLIKEVLWIDEQYSETLGAALSAHQGKLTPDEITTIAQIGGIRIGYANVLSAVFGINIYDKAHPL